MDKMKDIKLIALDLDGTTLADSDTLSKRTQTAIESAIKSGITVVGGKRQTVCYDARQRDEHCRSGLCDYLERRCNKPVR